MNSPSAPVSSRTFVSTVLFPVTVLIIIGIEMCIDLILESVIITEEILSVSIVTIEFSSNMSSYTSSFSLGSMPATMFLICASTIFVTNVQSQVICHATPSWDRFYFYYLFYICYHLSFDTFYLCYLLMFRQFSFLSPLYFGSIYLSFLS